MGGEKLFWYPDTIIVPPVYFSNPEAIAYSWGNCTGLGDINFDGYDDFSMQYWEYCFNDTFHYISDSVTYVYYGSSSLDSIILGVDTLFIGDICGDLGKISNIDQKSLFCKPNNVNNQIPGLNIVYANNINAVEAHYSSNDVGNITPGDINNDGYNDWIVWDSSEDQVKGYFGGSSLDINYDFVTPDNFQFNNAKESNMYILGDICGDGYDKILFTEKINDQYYDLYCFSHNEVKTGIDEIVPEQYDLLNIYPNPFNPTTTIEYAIPEDSNIKLSIYDISGHLVETLVDEYHQAGAYRVKWNASKYSSGIYISRLKSSYGTHSKKMVLIK